MNFSLFYLLEETNSDDSRTSSYDDYANHIDAVNSTNFSVLLLKINFCLY